MTLVRLEPAAPRSRVKHSTTEPLRSLRGILMLVNNWIPIFKFSENICCAHTSYLLILLFNGYAGYGDYIKKLFSMHL